MKRAALNATVLITASLLFAFLALVAVVQDFDPFLTTKQRIESIESLGGFLNSGRIEPPLRRSATVELLEDGVLIGDSSSSRDQVRAAGYGHFRCLRRFVLFSSSDGTNPLENSRQYEIRTPIILPGWIPGLLVSLSLVPILILAVSSGRTGRLIPFLLRTGRVCGFAGLFLFGLLGTARLIGVAVPTSIEALFDWKLATFTPPGETPPNVAFIGSSRTYRHIVPVVLDSIMAEKGQETRSYNFGVQGARVFEMPRILERILKADLDHYLKWIVISLERPGWDVRSANLKSARLADYHDNRAMRRAFQYYLTNQSRAMGDRARAFAKRFVPYLRGRLSFSRGSTWIRARMDPKATRYRIRRLEGQGHSRGFLSVDDDMKTAVGKSLEVLRERHARFLEGREGEQVAGPNPGPPGRTPPPAYELFAEVLQDLSSMVRDHGAVPVFLSHPINQSREDLAAADSTGVIEHFIAIDNRTDYPHLFRAELRFDQGHLNQDGAIEYTKILADRLSLIIATEESDQ